MDSHPNPFICEIEGVTGPLVVIIILFNLLSIHAICIYRKPYKKSLNFLPNDIYTLNNIFKFIKSTSQKYS